MKKIIKEEGFKFWILIPLYTTINTLISFIISNGWLILWYLFWFNIFVLMVIYGSKSIIEQWEEYKKQKLKNKLDK